MKMNIGSLFIAGVAILGALAVFSSAPIEAAGDTALASLEKDGDLLRVEKIKGVLPSDPGDARWREAREYTVPLVSQFAVVPRSAELVRSELRVRALYNDSELALLVVSADPTRNDDLSAAGHFGDAIAVGFPTENGRDVALPYIGMGNEGRPVNIWQWKAAWQRDIDNGYLGVEQAYPNRVPISALNKHVAGLEAGSPLSQTSRTSPVENMLAEGFGTLTSSPSRGLEGKGKYRDGAWRVVMKRPLKPRGVGARIRPAGGLLPITFAVWDGAAGERNGMKGLTRWRFLAFSGEKESARQGAAAAAVLAGTDAAKGEQLAVGLGCSNCHALPGRPPGGNVGPDLRYAGAIHRPEYLLESVLSPNAVVVRAPGYYDQGSGLSTMPRYDNIREDDDDPESKLLVTNDDLRDIAAYLWTLR